MSGTPTRSSSASPTAPTTTAPSTPTTPEPTPTQDDPGDYEAFKKRCLEESSEPDTATLFYEDEVELDVGKAHRFVVAIAEEASDAPTGVGPAQSELSLVCSVEARLVAPSSKLEISPRGWATDKYFPPEPATWTWVVTASAPGTVEAVLQLKPVVITNNVNGTVRTDDLGVEVFDVSFSTDQSATGWISSWWARLVGFATGAAALLGLYLMIRSLRRGRSGSDAETAA